jgi:competence protein ComEA
MNDDDLRPPDDADGPWRVRLARLLEFRPREVIALALVGALVLAGAVVAFARARPKGEVPPPAPVAAPSPVPTASPATRLFVHVAGAVRSPGVYEFATGARVIDAVRAAGGAGPGADLNAVNLARPVADGERVYIPRRGEAPPPETGAGGSDATAPSAQAKVNLNTATEAQLEDLPGIGPVLAQRIIEYRTQHGPFRSVRDLLKVEGIGEKKFATIEPHVTV